MNGEVTKIAIFESSEIRKQLHKGEWWFVLQDVVVALIDSSDASQYIKRLRSRDEELNELFVSTVDKGGVQIVPPLALSFDTPGGKQKLLSWNTRGVLRLIQSIPSKKAEPFKRWLAQVGYERIQEIEDPELAQKRMEDTYRAKGYSDDWIKRRVRGIAVRAELTDEWSKRGVREGKEYGILTAEISKATFGITPSQYKKKKKLARENLRDHMTDLELIFTMLGEASTTEIARTNDAQGLAKNRDAAQRGGAVAGKARLHLEGETGEKVVTGKNYLSPPDKNQPKI